MKPFTLYRFDCEDHLRDAWAAKGFMRDHPYLVICEISNQPGTVAAVNRDGLVIRGVRSHYFVEYGSEDNGRVL